MKDFFKTLTDYMIAGVLAIAFYNAGADFLGAAVMATAFSIALDRAVQLITLPLKRMKE